MKFFSILLIVTLSFLKPYAQKKQPMPGKEETIEFLNKKEKEIIGYNKLGIDRKIFINKMLITDGYVKRTATGIEALIAVKSGDLSYRTTSSFNPKHILSITNVSSNNVATESPIGTLEIKFTGKTALYFDSRNTNNVEVIQFNFLQADPDNEAQIIKALLHLKSIYREEDNLF